MTTVAVITPGSLPVPPVLGGGIETVVYDYARSNPKQKIIIVSGLDGGLPAEEIDTYGIEHIRIRNKSYDNFEIVFKHEYIVRYSRYIYKACAALKERNVDVIHIHNMPHWVPIVREKLGPKVKLILTNHNEKINQEAYAKKRLKKIMDTVDLVVYPSKRIAELDLTEKNPQYKSKVKVIYNGVDVDFFKKYARADIEQVKKKYSLFSQKIVLFVGRLVWEKAADQVLAAMQEVIKTEKDAILVIVGSSFFGKGLQTPYVKKLQSLAEPIKDNVLFTGFIEVADLPVLYSMAMAFVSPVVWDDPSPKTIYEAAACQAPIVATQRGGIPEIVKNGESAILLDTPYTTPELAEVIIDMLREPDTGALLGQQARARMLERFTVPKIAREWADLYEEITA